jgi:hypothetical protein
VARNDKAKKNTDSIRNIIAMKIYIFRRQRTTNKPVLKNNCLENLHIAPPEDN